MWHAQTWMYFLNATICYSICYNLSLNCCWVRLIISCKQESVSLPVRVSDGVLIHLEKRNIKNLYFNFCFCCSHCHNGWTAATFLFSLKRYFSVRDSRLKANKTHFSLSPLLWWGKFPLFVDVVFIAMSENWSWKYNDL